MLERNIRLGSRPRPPRRDRPELNSRAGRRRVQNFQHVIRTSTTGVRVLFRVIKMSRTNLKYKLDSLPRGDLARQRKGNKDKR
jgi:hypothetical protein